ncbi:hypothetical protein [Roseateles sp. LKC17W]|uniref:Glycosyltransferase RgtA/B/C/D-like domain-containing protein n=1 Tax=Pelomonas margarita TaxID=3299031 RepID=A0ABW7FPZ5_9BURK
MTPRRYLPILLLVTLAVGALAIDQRSLWTDEIGTWSTAVANGPMDWALRFWHHHNSDGQIPLYHLFMYLWTQAAGTSELALRLANLPWLLLALLGLHRLRLEAPVRWLAIGIFCLHPLVWYQLNEARPYLLHLAGACWLMTGCINLLQAQREDDTDTSWRELLIGSFLLIGSSALGAFWIFGALAAFIACNRPPLMSLIGAARRQPGFTLLLLLGCALIITVAAHSHLSGARASLAASFSVGGLVYGFIELLGAAGLGPSRHDLRTQLRLADPTQLGMMFAAAVLLACCLLAAWRGLKGARPRCFAAISLLLPIAMLAAVGLLLHWRVVGRHLSGALPLLCLAMACFAHKAWQEKQLIARGLAAAMLLALAASTLAIRVADRHGKDDYRQAAQWARAALQEGKVVLWLANERAIGYYRLAGWTPDGIVDMPAKLIPFTHYPAYKATGAPAPDIVIYSPREGVDPSGLARPLLQTGAYTRTDTAIAFELHQKH